MATTTAQIEYLPIDQKYKRPDQGKKYPPALFLIRILLQTAGRIFPNLVSKIAFKLFATPLVRAKHKTSDKLLESAKIFDFLYAGELLKGYEWGEGSKIAVLIHGWESRGTALRSIVPYLLADGYRVVTFDGPAHGNSTGKRTHLLHFSRALKALLCRIGKVDFVITHSFGGAAIAYAMQRLMPEFQLHKLVMIAVPSTMQSIFKEAREVMNMPAVVAKKVKEKMESLAGEPLEDLSLPKLGKYIKADEVLIIHDVSDKVVPIKFAEEIFEQWPQSHLVATEGLGHYRILKNETVLKRIHDFLSK